MKHASIALLAGIALMACAPSPTTTAPVEPTPGPEAAAPMTPEAAPPVDPAMPSADACGALQYQALIGKPTTEPGVPAEGLNVRYIRPDRQVTMDFRADRLNIDIDAGGMIKGFRCT